MSFGKLHVITVLGFFFSFTKNDFACLTFCDHGTGHGKIQPQLVRSCNGNLIRKGKHYKKCVAVLQRLYKNVIQFPVLDGIASQQVHIST